MEFNRVGTEAFLAMGAGLIIAIVVPLLIALIWKFKKKERFTTVLVGAAVFLIFALVLEKPIQNLIIMPSGYGLPDHALSTFLNAHPVLWAIVVALFPGVFEETGRFVAFKTVLRKRKNRETSISFGIGHGGIEVMFILGLTFLEYILYGVMINTGAINTVMDQVKAALPPDQVQANYEAFNAIGAFGFADLGVMVFERIFAVLFHIGASIIVFYAARDKEKTGLYPLAILLHTILDGIAALSIAGVLNLSTWALEAVVAVCGCATFFGALFLLYKKDSANSNLA